MNTLKQKCWSTTMHWLVFAAVAGLAGCGGGSSGNDNTDNEGNNSSSSSSIANGNNGSSSVANDSSSVANGSSSSVPNGVVPDPDPELQSYDVLLEGKQEVPKVSTDQSATAAVTVNRTDMMVMAAMNLSDVVGVNAAHIHAGDVGTNGPVVFGFSDSGDNGIWVIEGEALTEVQHDALLAGGWYINVHTESFPDGELRGQILTDTQSLYVFTLSGNQEVPAVQTDAHGQGYLLYDSSNGILTLNTLAWDLTATAAHIHQAEAGMNGDILVGWDADSGTEGLWQLADGTVLGSDDIYALRTANLYVNVHTDAYPDGEIRGQILPDDTVLILFDLSAGQGVPAVTSDASGLGYLTLNTATGGLRLNVWAKDMEATGASIRQANTGENGDTVLALEEHEDHPGLWQTPENVAMSTGAQATLLAGGHYVNVYSADFPSGEIRGQITD
ncbi:CHRD domain-containing protein [Marinimicrobium alkaliphilum]|uniref:CHRD domain-containing protein n=1 Tax=Marinimicrobium alkaliphilum TaxID=2202654 RepID=UPI000DBAD108|nr:CHRD domain-containing protein [Marinimicrobium alkaliphilum]